MLGYLPQTDAPENAPWRRCRNSSRRTPTPSAAPRTCAALAWFQSIVAEQGLPYVAADDEANTWLPSPAGAKRPAYLVPAAQSAGALIAPTRC